MLPSSLAIPSRRSPEAGAWWKIQAKAILIYFVHLSTIFLLTFTEFFKLPVFPTCSDILWAPQEVGKRTSWFDPLTDSDCAILLAFFTPGLHSVGLHLNRKDSVMNIVKLHACVHIFDPEEARYRKSSASNLHKALGASCSHLTRAQILAQIKWQPCQSPNCKVKCCKDHAHLIGN